MPEKKDLTGDFITVVHLADGGYKFFPFDSELIHAYLDEERKKKQDEDKNFYKENSGAV